MKVTSGKTLNSLSLSQNTTTCFCQKYDASDALLSGNCRIWVKTLNNLKILQNTKKLKILFQDNSNDFLTKEQIMPTHTHTVSYTLVVAFLRFQHKKYQKYLLSFRGVVTNLIHAVNLSIFSFIFIYFHLRRFLNVIFVLLFDLQFCTAIIDLNHKYKLHLLNQIILF